MRIGIHLLDLIPGKIGGMEQYVKNLISYSIKQSDQCEIFLFLNKHNLDAFSERKDNVFKILIDEKEDRSPQLHRWIQDLNLSVWFCPLLVLEPLDVSIPSAVTIPDIQHEFYPEFFDPRILQWRLKKYQVSVENCSAVLTLSDYSKKTIIEKYKVAQEKVHAIHLDSSQEFYLNHDETMNRKVVRKYHLPDQYGFYPANTWPHKNHLNLLKAIDILKKKHNIKMKIVFTGSEQQEYASITTFIKEHDLSDQVYFLGYIPQAEVPYIYKNASFLVFPSLYEGFGIPLVEAMRTKTPIICSNSASIPEVVGDSALLFDPNDPEEIALKMLEVLNDTTRSELRSKAVKQAEKFCWEKCARITLQVFSEIEVH
ncbi:glycosyltransferase family 4 protein [Paenibacillus alkaliterrae]|uniref:glycosyltransferase family 4 protein n=1 Tax=Paenibacillus alkaliterrae TaxID=320909 RepID=UPI001F1749BA|nr:glycosyltransferase family 1 protein [Paenibacillus alkaliterrae]MCF2941698.1 glycosyltransferase family 4 protein [Paenibacillus alkaliterrae]